MVCPGGPPSLLLPAPSSKEALVLSAEEGPHGLYPGSSVPRPARSQCTLGHLVLVFGVQEVVIVFSPPIL